MKKIYGTFGVEMRAYGQKFVKFCKHTHTHASKLVVEIMFTRMVLYECSRATEGRRLWRNMATGVYRGAAVSRLHETGDVEFTEI